MRNTLLAVLGSIVTAVCLAVGLGDQPADGGRDDICLRGEAGCDKDVQIKPASTTQGSGAAPRDPENKDNSINLELSDKTIDELYQSKSTADGNLRAKQFRRVEPENVLSTRDAELGAKIARAARVDCRTKYVSPETNLLVMIPLLIETITDTGCKW